MPVPACGFSDRMDLVNRLQQVLNEIEEERSGGNE